MGQITALRRRLYGTTCWGTSDPQRRSDPDGRSNYRSHWKIVC